MSKPYKEIRRKMGQRVFLMAASHGYVMVRFSGAMPFVMQEKEWLQLPLILKLTKGGE